MPSFLFVGFETSPLCTFWGGFIVRYAVPFDMPACLAASAIPPFFPRPPLAGFDILLVGIIIAVEVEGEQCDAIDLCFGELHFGGQEAEDLLIGWHG
jgi:hypothetical protein